MSDSRSIDFFKERLMKSIVCNLVSVWYHEESGEVKENVRMKKPYFPLFIDISRKKIVVIGGGKIAERRVRTLLAFAEHIQVVAPKLTEDLYRFAQSGQIDWRQENYVPEVLDKAEIVLAVTNDAACNEKIAEDCKERGIPVNTSHKKELCDFYFPAVVVKEHVVAGITASGYSHAQAKEARQRVEQVLKNMKNGEEQHE